MSVGVGVGVGVGVVVTGEAVAAARGVVPGAWAQTGTIPIKSRKTANNELRAWLRTGPTFCGFLIASLYAKVLIATVWIWF